MPNISPVSGDVAETDPISVLVTKLRKLDTVRNRCRHLIQQQTVSVPASDKPIRDILLDELREERVALNEETRELGRKFLDGDLLKGTQDGDIANQALREIAAFLKSSEQSVETLNYTGMQEDGGAFMQSVINTLLCSDLSKNVICLQKAFDVFGGKGFDEQLKARMSSEPICKFSLDVALPSPGNIGRLLTQDIEPSTLPPSIWNVSVRTLGPDSEALLIEVHCQQFSLYAAAPRAQSIEPKPVDDREQKFELPEGAPLSKQVDAWLHDAGFTLTPEFGVPIYTLEIPEENFAHPEGMRFRLVGSPGRHISSTGPIGLIIEAPGRENVVEAFPRFEPARTRLLDQYNISVTERLPRPEPVQDEPSDPGNETELPAEATPAIAADGDDPESADILEP